MSGTVLELARPEVWRTVLEQLPTGVYLLDSDQKIVFWNAGAERITGRLSQDVVGRLTRDQLVTRDEPGTSSVPAGGFLRYSLRFATGAVVCATYSSITKTAIACQFHFAPSRFATPRAT